MYIYKKNKGIIVYVFEMNDIFLLIDSSIDSYGWELSKIKRESSGI